MDTLFRKMHTCLLGFVLHIHEPFFLLFFEPMRDPKIHALVPFVLAVVACLHMRGIGVKQILLAACLVFGERSPQCGPAGTCYSPERICRLVKFCYVVFEDKQVDNKLLFAEST